VGPHEAHETADVGMPAGGKGLLELQGQSVPQWYVGHGGEEQTHHGEEKRVDSNDRPKLRSLLFIPDALVDGPDCKVTVAVQASPEGLDELVGSRVLGQLYDAVAEDDRYQRMGDGRGNTVRHGHRYHKETRTELGFG
jgi:hypothetical protein